MNLETLLLAGHSKAQCDRIVRYIGKDEKRFAQLMHLFFKSEYRIAQRAAWPMSCCVQKHPWLIEPYLQPLINGLTRKNVHNAVIRNTVRLLQNIEVPKRYHGKLMDACFNFIASPETPVAIKAFSLTILDNLSSVYPEIIPEMRTIIEERWEHETAAFRSRAKKILYR